MTPTRIATLLLTLLVLAPELHADKKAKPPKVVLPDLEDSQAPVRFDPQLLQRTYDRAKYKRNIGIGLAIPGVSLSLLGGLVIAFAAYDPNLLSKAEEFIGGGASALVGLAAGIPGIYFWTTGQDDMDVATWRMKQFEPAR